MADQGSLGFAGALPDLVLVVFSWFAGKGVEAVRFGLFGLPVLATIMLLTAAAEAQPAPEWRSCTGHSDVDWDRQIESCTAFIQSDQETSQNRAMAYVNRGIAYRAKGDLDHAIADYTEAIQLDPKDVKAYDKRGIAYGTKGDLDQAIADFTEAIRLNPKDDEAYFNRGVTYRTKKDFDRAIADFTEAIQLDPKDANAYYNRGIAYRAKGDLDHEIADYTQGIQLDPKHPSAYYIRASAYIKKGDLDHAIADYTEAIQLDPKDANAYYFRGNAYVAKGDLDDAFDDYNEAIRLNPKAANAYYFRGSAYVYEGKFDNAIADYTEAIRIDPKDPDAYGPRGLIYFHKSQFDLALTDFLRVIWLTLDDKERGTIAGYGLIVALIAVLIIALKKGRSWVSKISTGIWHAVHEAGTVVLRRWSLFLRYGWLPLVISTMASHWQEPLDKRWYFWWYKMGLPNDLIPGSASLIIIGLCLQAYAVRSHQIAINSDVGSSTSFWRAYLRFNAYALTLFAIGFAGISVTRAFPPPDIWMDRPIFGFPLWLIIFCLLAGACVLVIDIVARFSLMLPAAVLGYPLSPLSAWRLLHGNEWQLKAVIAVFVGSVAGLNWCIARAFRWMPDIGFPPLLTTYGSDALGQFNAYLATALIASILSIYYRRLAVSGHTEARTVGDESAAGEQAESAQS